MDKALDLHLILDNYSTHKTKQVQNWLKRLRRKTSQALAELASRGPWTSREPCSECERRVRREQAIVSLGFPFALLFDLQNANERSR